MRHSRVAIGLVGSLFLLGLLGCGRFGFSDHADQSIPLGDDAPPPQPPAPPPPCMESALNVSQGASSVFQPRIVWNGNKVGVAWFDDATPQQVQFRTVSLDGTLDPVASPGALAQGEAVDLAWDGTSFRLAWADDDPNRELMASTDGGAPVALTSNSRQDMRANVAPMSGGQIAYLWVTDKPSYSLRLTVVDAAGTKLVDDVAVATPIDLNTHSLVWTGSELVVFYDATPGLMMQRLTPGGVPVTGPIQVGTTPSELPFVAARWTGDRFLLAWDSASAIRIGYFGSDGARLFPAVGAAASQLYVFQIAVAVGPITDAVMWSDINGDSFVQEMNHDGSIGEVHTFPDTSDPSAAWTGKRWSVAMVQRVFPTPEHPDPVPDYINLVQMCSAAIPSAN